MQFVRQSVLFSALFVFLLAGCGDSEPVFTLKAQSKSKSKQVVLFFSLACPHCRTFDGLLDPWVEQKHEDVVFERIPVTFAKPEWAPLVQAYATLRTMNVQDKYTNRLFTAIHDKRFYVGDAESFSAWLSNFGFDRDQVIAAYNSPQTQKFIIAYRKAEQKYNVMSIPRLVINGNRELAIKQLEGEDKSLAVTATINRELSQVK